MQGQGSQMHKRHQQRMDRTDLFFSSGPQEQERYHVGDEDEIFAYNVVPPR